MNILIVKGLFIVYIGVLFYYGFICRRDNWLGWFMFCRASFCYANIRFKDELINIWDYIPHCQVILHKDMLNNLLWYLKAIRGMSPMVGTVVLYTSDGVVRHKVRNAWLV